MNSHIVWLSKEGRVTVIPSGVVGPVVLVRAEAGR